MTDINRAVAERILGWTLQWPQPEPGDHFSAAGDSFKWGTVTAYYVPPYMDRDAWKPDENLYQAFKVLDALKTKYPTLAVTLRYRHNPTEPKWLLHITDADVGFDRMTEAYTKHLAITICHTALYVCDHLRR